MDLDRLIRDAAAAVRAQDPVEFWTMAVILGLIGLFLFYFAFRSLRRARVIEDTPTSKVRSAAQGYVELFGRGELMDGEPIRAPLTDTVCTWWRYKIEKRVRTRRSTHWRTVAKKTSHSFFKLVDETGECLVDPEEAEVTSQHSHVWRGGSEWPEKGPDGETRIGGLRIGSGRYRYTEEHMYPGEVLYALGFFSTRRRSQVYDTERAVREMLTQWKADRDALLERFDADGDGEIDLQEWEQARKAAFREARAEQHRQMAEAGIDVIAAPDDGRPFLLSVHPQTDLAKRYRLKAMAGMAGFFLSGAADVFVIGARLAGHPL